MNTFLPWMTLLRLQGILHLMRYFGKPANIAWSTMSDFYSRTATNGSPTLQKLLKNLGLPSQLYVNYSCSGSGSYSSRIPPVLINTYNYSSTSYYTSSYIRKDVFSQISRGRPVVMGGDNGSVGHAWVCDGIMTRYERYCIGSTLMIDYYSTLLHMNWGWYGDYNGYYFEFGFNPANKNYNSHVDVVFINP